MNNVVLTEATYYILLSLYKPQHGYWYNKLFESGGEYWLA